MRIPCRPQQQIQFLGGIPVFSPLAPDVLEQEPLRQLAPSAYIFRNQCLRTLQMDTSAKGRAELCGQQRT